MRDINGKWAEEVVYRDEFYLLCMENGMFMVLDSAGHPVSIDIPFSNSSIFGSYIIGTSGRKKTSVLSIESGAIVANSSHGTVKSIYDDAMVVRAEDGS